MNSAHKQAPTKRRTQRAQHVQSGPGTVPRHDDPGFLLGLNKNRWKTRTVLYVLQVFTPLQAENPGKTWNPVLIISTVQRLQSYSPELAGQVFLSSSGGSVPKIPANSGVSFGQSFAGIAFPSRGNHTGSVTDFRVLDETVKTCAARYWIEKSTLSRSISFGCTENDSWKTCRLRRF